MAKTVLITGATGLIGSRLAALLLQKGYHVHTLSRKGSAGASGAVRPFLWNVSNGTIDEKCFQNVEAIIHLAGESIAGKPWTKERKKQIIDSRTNSIRLLYSTLARLPQHQVHDVISASAVGYYGHRGNELLTEKSQPGVDFMAKTCIEWETAVDEGKSLGLRIVKLRTGVVLSAEGGALPRMAAPIIRYGIGSALGSGKQWTPWIHIEDVLSMYLFMLEHPQLEGAFNQAAPNPVTNAELTRAIAAIFKKSLWLPNVPEFMLRIVLGEMKAVVTNSTRTSADKVIASGFHFRYPYLLPALRDIYG